MSDISQNIYEDYYYDEFYDVDEESPLLISEQEKISRERFEAALEQKTSLFIIHIRRLYSFLDMNKIPARKTFNELQAMAMRAQEKWELRTMDCLWKPHDCAEAMAYRVLEELQRS